jgi:glycosyltransferase involved in cell wall biosynthesis
VKLDIVSTLYGLEPGGAEISTRLLVDELVRAGIDVNVVTSRGEGASAPRAAVLSRLTRIPWQVMLYAPNRLLDTVIRKTLVEHWTVRKPDAVLVEDHLGIVGAFEAVEELRRRGHRIVLAVTQMWEVDAEFFFRFRPWPVAAAFVHRFRVANALEVRADFVNGATTYIRSRILDRLRVDPARCAVLHTIGLAEPRPLSPWSGGTPVFLAPGRINPEKGSLFFYDVVKELARRRRDFRAVFLGGGPYESKLRGRINADGLDDICEVTGKVPYERFLSLYGAATAVVAPIMYPSGYTRVVLESLDAGKPVVTFDHGSMPDVVINGVTGYRTPPFHVGAFAAACERFIDDPFSCAAMAPACRETARRFGDLRQASAELVAHLEAAYRQRYENLERSA